MSDYALEQTIDHKFTTRTSAGVPITFAGTPAVEIYEDNSTTQITAAETLTVDFDGVTGLHNLRIAATAANGFEAGKSYAAVVSAGTVDGNSVVGEVIFNFSIERSAALANHPANFNQLGIESDGDLTKVNTLDGHTPQTADHTAAIADVPTVAEFNARTLVAANYFDPATMTVANVTLVGTCTNNSDMRGTDSASTHSAADVWTSGTRTLTATVDANVIEWSGYTLIAGMIEDDAGASRWVTKALEQAPSGGGGGGDATEAKQDTIIAAIATVDTNVDSILVDTGTTLPARFTGIEGATFSTSTDSLEAIRNAVDGISGGSGSLTSNYAAAVKNQVFDFTTKLYDSSGNVVSSPTLAAGDVLVTNDAGTPANIGTLPTVANDDQITVSLTADEMNADSVIVEFEDQAGGEWEPVTFHISPQVLTSQSGGVTYADGEVVVVVDESNEIIVTVED